jgi:hypothetical protein
VPEADPGSDREKVNFSNPARLLLLAPVLLGMSAWGAAALWFDGPASRPLAGLLAAAFLAASLAILIWVRPFRRALADFALLFALVLLWWICIPPRQDRDWDPAVARPASARIEGDRVTISNVRNFAYRGSDQDFEARWEERSYDLSKLRGADLFLSYWGSPWIAHTIMSWDFGDDGHLAISIETRKEKGEAYSAVRGFFRQFELYYVVADERDLIGVRTGPRAEETYLYRLRIPTEFARAVLLRYLAEINRLALRPRWYNAFTHNCTTAIRYHIREVSQGNPWSWRILVNGKLDEMIYERGTIDTSLPFAELRARSFISEKAKAAAGSADFSERIRAGLPGER